MVVLDGNGQVVKRFQSDEVEVWMMDHIPASYIVNSEVINPSRPERFRSVDERTGEFIDIFPN